MYFSDIWANIPYIPMILVGFLYMAAYPAATFVFLYPSVLLSKWLKKRNNIGKVWKLLISIIVTLTLFIILLMLHEILIVSDQEEAYERGTAHLLILLQVLPMIYVLIKNIDKITGKDYLPF